MIASLLLGLAADGLAPTKTAVLPCGRGTFNVASRRDAAAQAPLAPVTQTMTVRAAGQRRALALEPTRTVPVDGHRVRNRYLLSWACVTSTTGARYVALGYACAVDPGYPNDCGGQREWFRLLDDRGRAVDRGVPVDGPARDRLHRRLGLARTFADGLHMTSVLD